MVQNILALLKDQLDDNLIGKIAGFLGENKSGVTSAVSSALPALLLGLMKKGSEPGGAEGLMKILQEGKHDSGILDNIGSVLDGGSATTNLLSRERTCSVRSSGTRPAESAILSPKPAA